MATASVPVRIDTTRARPVIAGTRIKVSQVAHEFECRGMAPDEIVEAHPHLTLADVHAALAYFYDHTEMIREEWRQAEELVNELQAVYGNPAS